uniref:Uncharacterized protein n=1 Tax=Anguilla anguilla TaxID=7936 RepID=A0A0E9XP44_ANGAN
MSNPHPRGSDHYVGSFARQLTHIVSDVRASSAGVAPK